MWLAPARNHSTRPNGVAPTRGPQRNGIFPFNIYRLSKLRAPTRPKTPKNAELAFEQAYNACFQRERHSIRTLTKEFGLTSQADYKRLLARIHANASDYKPIATMDLSSSSSLLVTLPHNLKYSLIPVIVSSSTTISDYTSATTTSASTCVCP